MHVHHDHAHHHPGNARRMAIALAINLAMLAAAVAGWLAFDSVALLADAGHVLSDIGAIGLGSPRLGRRRARRAAGARSGSAGPRSSPRCERPPADRGGRLGVHRGDRPPLRRARRGRRGVAAVGAFGLIGNGVATLVLARGDRDDINLEGVLRHSAADALGSLGALVAGVVIATGGPDEADAVAALLIGGLIVLGRGG